MATPKRLEIESRGAEMIKRLERCWESDIDWTLYPEHLKDYKLHMTISAYLYKQL